MEGYEQAAREKDEAQIRQVEKLQKLEREKLEKQLHEAKEKAPRHARKPARASLTRGRRPASIARAIHKREACKYITHIDTQLTAPASFITSAGLVEGLRWRSREHPHSRLGKEKNVS